MARESPPTSRAVDVVELLVRADEGRLQFSDIVRALGASQATTHAILATLCERGWATKDSTSKSYRPGPALRALAAEVHARDPLAEAAKSVTADLTATLGFSSSVVERDGNHLTVTAFTRGGNGHRAATAGERIPYAPPFGAAFAAWAPVDEQQSWTRRAGGDITVNARLEQILARIRERGFDVDWTTPALVQAAHLVDLLDDDGIPPHVRRITDTLIADFTSVGYLSDDDPERAARPVFSITAPIINTGGAVAMVIGIHPLRSMDSAEVTEAGRHVMRAAAAINASGIP